MGDSKVGAEQRERKLVLRPIIGLTANLSSTDLEQITARAIRKHRRLRDIAESKEQDLKGSLPKDALVDTVGAARLAYIEAMVDMHAQQAVVSTLLDLLGYIPTVTDN